MVQVNVRGQRAAPLTGEPLSWRGQVNSHERPGQQMPLNSNSQATHVTGCRPDDAEIRDSLEQQKCAYRVYRSGEKRARKETVPVVEPRPLIANPWEEEENCGGDARRKSVEKALENVVDLRCMTQASLLKLANEHRLVVGGENPFEETWGHGLLERVCLPPDRKGVVPFTLGGDPMCAKAWRSIVGGGGMRSFGKFDGDPVAGEMGGVAQFVPTVSIDRIPEDQRPFVAALEEFLQRSVSLPILSSTSELLNLEKLFTEVVSMGGHERVTQAKNWPILGQSLQANSELGECLQQVYMYYLSPLEEITPKPSSPTDALTWLNWAKNRSRLTSLFQSEEAGLRKRMKFSKENLPEESLRLMHDLARDPVGLDVPSELENWLSGCSQSGMEKSVEGSSGAAAESERKPSESGADVTMSDDEMARWVLICSHYAQRFPPPGAGLRAPVLKPPVPLPIKLPFSLLATAGFTKKNTGKRTWLADSAGKRIVTPKCGVCRTCSNPQLKKACLTNRDRLAKGMEPLLVQPAAKLK
ncbi:hypothetical protein BSKO_01715 [Bryopsis sp. KO-2023]|nr:hypothetical protein BSKO_01715 [Bryopsis sp. KO-2023]